MTTIMVGISGVGARFAPRTDGVRDLVREINSLNIPGVTARYHRWTADPGELAACIKALASVALASVDPHTHIVFFAHSRGGVTACQTAERLGLSVIMVFADVWNKDHVLKVPAVVTDVWSWRETWDRPRGAELIAGPQTVWRVNEIVTAVSHMKMDELPAFRDVVLSLAKGEI